MKDISTTCGVFCLLAASLLTAATGAFRGVVHDPQHRPLPGAQVILRARDASETKTVQSDANGEFQIDGVPQGSYTVRVSAQGFQSLDQQATVTADKTPVCTYNLTSPL